MTANPTIADTSNRIMNFDFGDTGIILPEISLCHMFIASSIA